MFLLSAGQNNSQMDSKVLLKSTKNCFYKLHHQIPTNALIESIDDNNFRIRRLGSGSSRRQHGGTDQLVELMLKPLVENSRILPDDVSNVGLSGWDREGDLIGKRRNGTRDGVSTASASKKEETGSKSALGIIVFGNG